MQVSITTLVAGAGAKAILVTRMRKDLIARQFVLWVFVLTAFLCACSATTGSGFSTTLDQVELCAGRQYEIPDVLIEIRESLTRYISTSGLENRIDAATLDNLLNSKYLSAVKREQIGESSLVTYRYVQPYAGLFVGATRGIDIIFIPCAWEIRDIVFWHTDEQ